MSGRIHHRYVYRKMKTSVWLLNLKMVITVQTGAALTAVIHYEAAGTSVLFPILSSRSGISLHCQHPAVRTKPTLHIDSAHSRT